MKDIDVLIEALPYIKKFHDKKILIKYGGHAMVDEEAKSSTARDTVLLKYVGMKPLIVHGGGPEISKSMDKLGKESKFIKGLRVTDEETVEIAEMVLDGKVNSDVVNMLNCRGVRAVGLSGKDAGMIKARKKMATVYNEDGNTEKVDIGYVGEVESIDISIVQDLLERDYIPVIAPIGVGQDGESYNINADYVAAEIAGALHAEKLLLLTDIDGVYKDFEDKDSFISTLTVAEAKEYIKDGIISGGMIPKIEACLKSIEAGTNKVHIIDGRQPHSIILELLTNSGIGTQVVK